jgi:hypothetical protein
MRDGSGDSRPLHQYFFAMIFDFIDPNVAAGQYTHFFPGFIKKKRGQTAYVQINEQLLILNDFQCTKADHVGQFFGQRLNLRL